jgi:hypothetical protein
MKTLFLSLLLLSSTLAQAADDVEALIGQYTLKTAVSGDCYGKLEIRREYFLGSTGPDLGIYGLPMNGYVVFQFESINSGLKIGKETNAMTGELMGFSYAESKVENGQFSGSRKAVKLSGDVVSQEEISGSLKDGTLSFKVSEVNLVTPPGFHRSSSCVYSKNN